MTDCGECGARLAVGAEFCSSCGTRVAPSLIEPEKKADERRLGRILTGIGVIIIGIAIVLAIVFYGPVRSVSNTDSREVPYQANVDKIDLDVDADIVDVSIDFEDLSENLFTLDLTIYGGVSVFDEPDDVDFNYDDTIAGDTLTVTVGIDTPKDWDPFLNVKCEMRIDHSLEADLNVTTDAGKITLDTVSGVEFGYLSLETDTGAIRADLVEDVKIAHDISFKTDTADIDISWRNLDVSHDFVVSVNTETGGVDVSIAQDAGMSEDVTVHIHTTTGGVDLTMDIEGDIGARIVANTDTGGFHVIKRDGFSRTGSILESDNYPEDDNFIVNINTDTGGIDVEASYSP